MSEPEIKIIKITRLTGNRPVKAFVDVQIGDWTIFDWRIIQRGPDEPFEVSYPLVSYRDKNGVIRYRSLLLLPSPVKQSIDLQILLAWSAEVKRGSNSNNADN